LENVIYEVVENGIVYGVKYGLKVFDENVFGGMGMMYVLVCGGSCCFPCVNGLCPYGLDPLKDCCSRMDPEIRALFEELVDLRACYMRR